MPNGLDLGKLDEYLKNSTKEDVEKRKLIAMEQGIKRQLGKLNKERSFFTIEDESEPSFSTGKVELPSDGELTELKELHKEVDTLRQAKQENELYMSMLGHKLSVIEQMSFLRRLGFLLGGYKYLLKIEPVE